MTLTHLKEGGEEENGVAGWVNTMATLNTASPLNFAAPSSHLCSYNEVTIGLEFNEFQCYIIFCIHILGNHFSL